MKTKLITLIEAYESICIFRHVGPDGDALGSQWGMLQFIKDNYPEKKVYALGENNPALSLFPSSHIVDDEVIKESLAIILDAAVMDRIDDVRYALAVETVNIDHHPSDVPYGDHVFVDATRASTCEILTELIQGNGLVSEKTASYLLSGILTDTIRFSVEATTSQTLSAATFLMDCGADISRLSRLYFSRSYKSFKLASYFANQVVYDNGLAVLVISKETREQLGLSEREAKLFNSVMGGVIEFEIWAIYVETDDHHYMGSIRSKDITINTTCERYNGGGHRLACGVKELTREMVDAINQEFKNLINEFRKDA